LSEERAKLQSDFSTNAEQLIPLQTQALRLQQEVQKSERAIVQKVALMAQVQRNIQPRYSNQMSSAQLEANNHSAVAAINQMSNEVLAMRTAMQPVRDELGRVQQEITQHKVRRSALEAQLSAMHGRWAVVLSPEHVNAGEKASYLRAIHGRHAEVPEVGLWLACLLFYDGRKDEAAMTLDAVDRVVSSPATICLLDSKWEFVYLSLTIDKSDIARSRFERFFKAWPKHPQNEHLRAMVAIRDGNFSVAKTNFVAALKRKGSDRNVLLNSDAAWFFSAAPRESIRDKSLAQTCADRALEWRRVGAYKALRASAAIAAREHDWEAAKKCLEDAKTCAPKPLLDDIQTQFEAYAAETQFVFAAERNDGKALPAAAR
jgi:hypothetical protein